MDQSAAAKQLVSFRPDLWLLISTSLYNLNFEIVLILNLLLCIYYNK